MISLMRLLHGFHFPGNFENYTLGYYVRRYLGRYIGLSTGYVPVLNLPVVVNSKYSCILSIPCLGDP